MTKDFSLHIVTLVRDKIEIEKYLAIMTNNRTTFVKKWSNIAHLL